MVSASSLFFATRPWSFPVTGCAIAVGGSLAFVDAPARFSWPLLSLSLAGGLLVHAAANLINTYGDYTKGVDVKASADDRAIVDGHVTALQIYRLIVACLLAATAVLGLVVAVVQQRPPLSSAVTLATPAVDLLLLSVLGVFIAYAYTAPPFYWKYKGLGDVCIVAAYGPLLVMGAYFCQLSALPPVQSLLFALAPGLCTDAILHSNNTRDQAWDAQCGAVTLPMKLGPRLSGLYFIGLFVLSFAAVVATAAWPSAFLPGLHGAGAGRAQWSWAQAALLLPLLLVPRSVELVRRYYAAEFKDLCPRCGVFGGQFGVLQSIGLVTYAVATRHAAKA